MASEPRICGALCSCPKCKDRDAKNVGDQLFNVMRDLAAQEREEIWRDLTDSREERREEEH